MPVKPATILHDVASLAQLIKRRDAPAYLHRLWGRAEMAAQGYDDAVAFRLPRGARTARRVRATVIASEFSRAVNGWLVGARSAPPRHGRLVSCGFGTHRAHVAPPWTRSGAGW